MVGLRELDFNQTADVLFLVVGLTMSFGKDQTRLNGMACSIASPPTNAAILPRNARRFIRRDPDRSQGHRVYSFRSLFACQSSSSSGDTGTGIASEGTGSQCKPSFCTQHITGLAPGLSLLQRRIQRLPTCSSLHPSPSIPICHPFAGDSGRGAGGIGGLQLQHPASKSVSARTRPFMFNPHRNDSKKLAHSRSQAVGLHGCDGSYCHHITVSAGVIVLLQVGVPFCPNGSQFASP